MVDIRKFLCDEMNKVSTAESTPAIANACANLAGKVLQSVKMELEYSRMTGVNTEIKFLNGITSKIKKLENKG